jgi:hypothetical protein
LIDIKSAQRGPRKLTVRQPAAIPRNGSFARVTKNAATAGSRAGTHEKRDVRYTS